MQVRVRERSRDHNAKKVMRKNKGALGWRMDCFRAYVKKQRPLKRRQILGASNTES